MFFKNKQQKGFTPTPKFFGVSSQSERGFTLVELLVVIAIIGILSAVVLASLNTARERGRDAKRIGDLNNVRLALEFYFDDVGDGAYPETLDLLVAAGHLPVVPLDPNGDPYDYSALGADCGDYHLRATLEGTSNVVLDSDADADASLDICGTSAADENGTDPIYDLKP